MAKAPEITEAKIRQVLWMIKAGKTKKACCEHLGIAYNTKKLDTIIEDFHKGVDREADLKKAARNKIFTAKEKQMIADSYLNGEAQSNLAKQFYVSPQKVKILQEADYIFIQELIKNNLYDKIWQAYAALLPVKTVGVMGDSRTYEYICLIRAVVSEDGMTADYFNFPKNFLDKISNKIINGVKGINRVVYDITSKPPSTIELE